jgi:hypothetical protein
LRKLGKTSYQLYHSIVDLLYCNPGAVLVIIIIIWKLDLQLPVHSVPITTNVVSSNPAQARCTSGLRVRVMVFNVIFNNISAISWRSVLLVKETGENLWPAASQPDLFTSYILCINYIKFENLHFNDIRLLSLFISDSFTIYK